ncbi:MAG: PKD domain-containing protein [Anaerolineae bacterium]|nr:PKD domain-containing protein [Anaerolineae bacterium]
MAKRLLLVGILLFLAVAGTGPAPALADEHLGFESLEVGYVFDTTHQAYEHLGITITSNATPEVVMADWLSSPSQVLSNAGDLPGPPLRFTLDFQADSVSLWVTKASVFEVTAVLTATGPTGLVGTDTVVLPIGTIDYLVQLTVEAGPDEAIDEFMVSYGWVDAETVDDITIHEREGPSIPPPVDTTPPDVHITHPAPAATVAGLGVSGYIDEDVELEDTITIQTPLETGTYALADRQWREADGLWRYWFFGTPAFQEGENLLHVTASDTAGHTVIATVNAFYHPREYAPPPTYWPDTLDIRAGSEEECGVTQCGMEVTQAIQSWRQIGPTPSDPHSDPTALIAGKKTLVRVYGEAMGVTIDVPGVNGKLEGYHGATPLPGSPIYAEQRVTLVPGEDYLDQRSDPNKSLNFILPPEWTEPGAITLIATVNPHQNPPEGLGNFDVYNSVSLDVTFHESERFCVFVHPLQAHAHGNATPTLSERVENLALTRQIYPVSPSQFRLIHGSTYHAYLSFDTGESWLDDFNLFLTATGLLATLPSHYGQASGCDEVAFLNLTDDTVRHRGISLPPLAVSVADDSFGEQMRTAHELGHSQGLWHVESCDEPWPFNDEYPSYRDATVSGDPVFMPHGSIGDFGVNIADDNSLTVLDPATVRDFMTYCDDLWMSEWTWQWMREHFRPGSTSAAATGAGLDSLPAITSEAQIEPYLVINGTIGPTGTTTLEPAWTQMLPAGSSDHPGTGDYLIELLDASNNVLFARHFSPTLAFEAEQFAMFQEVVPKEAGTRRIRLSGGAIATPVLKAAGASAPLVGIAAPAEAWEATGSREITWLAGDADGDDVTNTILYSADDGATWQVIGSNITGQWGMAVELDNLPGCQNTCRLRQLATDDINQSESTTAPFSKEGQPPWVNIVSPKSVAVFSHWGQIILEGLVSDLEEASLPDANLQWTSDRDGDLGTGLIVGVTGLSAGLHQITLTATDSEGMSSSDTIRIYIEPFYQVYIPVIVRVYE